MCTKRLPTKTIQKFLRAKQAFPKDVYLDSGEDHLGENRFREQHRRDEICLLHALLQPWADDGHRRQAQKIASCDREHPCKDSGCWLCKHFQWLRCLRACTDALGDAKSSEISFVTIVSGVASVKRYSSIQKLIVDTEKRWHARIKRVCPKARWVGRFEFDVIDLTRSHLGNFKLRTLEDLGLEKLLPDPYAETDEDEFGCVPHLHALVVHPGLSRRRLSAYLQLEFRESRQIQVKWRTNQKIQTNVSKISQYMTKSRPPEWALYGRGSRTYTPRNPEAILIFHKLTKAFGPWLSFDSAKLPSYVK